MNGNQLNGTMPSQLGQLTDLGKRKDSDAHCEGMCFDENKLTGALRPLRAWPLARTQVVALSSKPASWNHSLEDRPDGSSDGDSRLGEPAHWARAQPPLQAVHELLNRSGGRPPTI
jgi:hypothetical protein